ncbi:MAG: pyridoxamine 5'-phosphate oxidase [Ignavibacteriaceae bacterium]|jgi:pyridoxamine 5'-phosphate oxidase
MNPNEKTPLANLRVDYKSAELNETHIRQDPIEQFENWFNDSIHAKIYEPNAMTLATSSGDGLPNARIVLLKGFDKNGFVFYTNYESHKGQELEYNPKVALLFFWKELARQVRIKGKVEKISRKESDEYFHSRPKESQLGAWASNQSSEIPDRKFLEERFKTLQKKFGGKEIPLPPHWGGYRVVPFEIEFWQGRENRLHDRIVYRLVENDWKISRLSP